MFGTNEIVGQKYFKDAQGQRKLFVTSIFFTLQGEGPYSGRVAVFLRLTKCNLACSFCDTFFDDGDWMSFEAINQTITNSIRAQWLDKGKSVPDWVESAETRNKEVGKFPGVVLVVTGGEPLLQANLMDYLSETKDMYGNSQIESNGTINQDVPPHVTLVCSPKCAEKNGVAVKYLHPTKLILERADCLKFVISSDPTSPYAQVPDWALEWKRATNKEIYVSPMNIYNNLPQKIKLLRAESGVITLAERSTVDEVISFWEPGLLNMPANQANHEYAAQYAINNGFRLQLQVHLYASLA